MFDSTRRRHDDFMTACRREAHNWDGDTPPSVDEIIRKVISGGAPRFYLSLDTALMKTGGYLSGKTPVPRTQQGLMWRDFAERVGARLEADPELTLYQAITNTLNDDEAPSFYLTFNSARRLYYRYRARRRAQRPHRIGRRGLF